MLGKKAVTKTVAITIVVLLAIAIAAYAFWPRAPSTPQVIKIGSVLPLTPPGAYMSGAEMKMAMELAVKEINNAGGVLGKPIQLFVEDTRGIPEAGVSAMEKLIAKENVIAVVGAFHSSVTLANMEVAQRNAIPYITLAPWSNLITAKGYKYIFRLGLCNAIHFTYVGDFVKEQGFTRAIIVVENTDFGLGAADDVKKVLEKAGIKYEMLSLDMGTTDFTPVLGKIKSFEPNAIINIFTGLAGYTLVSQLHDAGIAPTAKCALIYPLDESIAPEYWDTLGEKGLYVVAYTMFHPAATLSPKTKDFIAKFEKEYNRMPTVVCLQAYDGIYVICEAIKRAGSTKGDDIVKALEEMKYDGVLGPIEFSKGPQEGLPNYMFHNMKNPPDLFIQYAKVKQKSIDAPVIWPSKYATAKYVVPP
jgi:ABC-type branched-subunit amino acid transport system substrate-binding protein